MQFFLQKKGWGIVLLVLLAIAMPLNAQQRKKSHDQLYPYSVLEASNNRMLFGFMNPKGQSVIDPQFYAVGLFYPSFSEGRAPVLTADGTYGYIDGKGKMTIMVSDTPLVDMGPFKEGLAWIQPANGTFYFINTHGERLPFDALQAAKNFSEGLAPAMPQGGSLMGFIDKQGRYVIEPQFVDAWSFSEGLACVKVRVDGNASGVQDTKAPATYRYGFIDKKGRMVIEPRYTHAASFSEGVACVETASGTYLIGHDGNVVTVFDPSLRVPFYSERLLVDQLIPVVKDLQYGYVNRNGKMVVEPRFSYATTFVDGLARVYQNGEYGYIDTKGQMVWKGKVGLLRILHKPDADTEQDEDDYDYDYEVGPDSGYDEGFDEGYD
ncbi:MAG: WG repeat-containing protein, partial [Bacteroidales bacterium]|nr:WG repeat-containing protein [Bacteroidales bacterium]